MDLSPHDRELLRSVRNPRYPASLTRGYHSMLGALPLIREHFGDGAVSSIIYGLSRPLDGTKKDSWALINEWERRDTRCCYQGTPEELLQQDATVIYAVSYKHVWPEEEWRRHDPDLVCKFNDEDRELFTNAVAGIKKINGARNVMVWCDQVISTRFEANRSKNEDEIPWYLNGLLPYVAFPVLQLTISSEEDLEKRVWIRAERSLGRMGCGFLNGDDAACPVHARSGIGQMMVPSDAIRTIAKMIISGYWPEDLGYWKDDYRKMREWAVAVLCRGEKHLMALSLFEKHECIDNIEVLNRIDKFAILPPGLSEEEPVRWTPDKKFFLKVHAWNLALRKYYWKDEPGFVCHYMGYLGDSRFSWWQAESRKYLFGCFADHVNTSYVLAEKIRNGYQVFRCMGNLMYYQHAERLAGPATRTAIREATERSKNAQKEDDVVDFHITDSLEWNLCYTSEDNSVNLRTHSNIARELGEQVIAADILVPQPFWGMTTKLYKSSIATRGSAESQAIARLFIRLTAEWNELVKQQYKDTVSLKDTTFGPVWLEGFDEEKVSFGYLDFITQALVLNTRCKPTNSLTLRSSDDMLWEISKTKRDISIDEQEVVNELFEPDNPSRRKRISKRDVAYYTLAGGFSSNFRTESPHLFLAASLASRGYWSTLIVCAYGKIQIRFRNSHGVRRIAQRRTKLADYAAKGFVHPQDTDAVYSNTISVPYSDEAGNDMFSIWWKGGMADTTTRGELCENFPHSMRVGSAGKRFLAVDMTFGDEDEEQPLLIADKYIVRAALSELNSIFDGSNLRTYWEDAGRYVERDNDLPDMHDLHSEAVDALKDSVNTIRIFKEVKSGKGSRSEQNKLVRASEQKEF